MGSSLFTCYDNVVPLNNVQRIGKILEKNNHKCIFYLETVPMQVSWCGNENKCELIEDCDENGFLPKRFFKIKRVFL